MSTEMMQVALAIAIFAMLFALGLGLRLEDFKKIAESPRSFVTIFLTQIIVLPLLAVTIASIFSLSESNALGLLLLAAAPGGVSSNVLTRLSAGHTALSVALTATNSLLAVATVPAVLFVGLALLGTNGQLIAIPFDYLVQQLLFVTFVPVACGVALRHFAKRAAEALERVLLPLTTVLFFTLIFTLWYTQFDSYRGAFAIAGWSATALFIAASMSAWALARANNLPRYDRITMFYEVGIQNPPVAFFIAINVVGDFALTPPAAVYAIVMIVLAIPVVPLVRRYKALA